MRVCVHACACVRVCVVPARGEPPRGGRGDAPDHFLVPCVSVAWVWVGGRGGVPDRLGDVELLKVLLSPRNLQWLGSSRNRAGAGWEINDDCECNDGERVMSGDGSGGAEGEESCESDVGEGGLRGSREVGKGEKNENEKGEWGDTCVFVVASVSSSAALGESTSIGRERSCWWRSGPGGGGGGGGGFHSHLLPGAWCMKILWCGVCAWCGLILGGELMFQFSLRPGCQLASLLLNVGLHSLHGSIMGCDLEMRERRRESCECFVHVLLCPSV